MASPLDHLRSCRDGRDHCPRLVPRAPCTTRRRAQRAPTTRPMRAARPAHLRRPPRDHEGARRLGPSGTPRRMPAGQRRRPQADPGTRHHQRASGDHHRQPARRTAAVAFLEPVIAATTTAHAQPNTVTQPESFSVADVLPDRCRPPPGELPALELRAMHPPEHPSKPRCLACKRGNCLRCRWLTHRVDCSCCCSWLTADVWQAFPSLRAVALEENP
jgi:hypothetical protein